MKIRHPHRFLCALLVGASAQIWAQPASVPAVLPEQASSKALAALGLAIADPVNAAASDAASASFQKGVLPDIVTLLKGSLGEKAVLADQSSLTLDPSKLLLSTESTARVYFVGEGAGYSNTLGFNTLQAGEKTPSVVLTKDAQVIFPNASSSVSSYDPAAKIVRTAANPLLPGDFVDLGSFSGGTTLDFFLISNGANGGTTAFSASAARNPDKVNHVVSFALPDSPYLILAFEDMFGGGDKDFNDVIFAVDVGRANIQQLVGAPEPQTWAIMIGFLGVLLLVERRVRQRTASSCAR